MKRYILKGAKNRHTNTSIVIKLDDKRSISLGGVEHLTESEYLLYIKDFVLVPAEDVIPRPGIAKTKKTSVVQPDRRATTTKEVKI